MAFSYQNYTGDNTTDTFAIPFTFTDNSEISVTVDGVAETGLTFPSAASVQLTSAPATGTLVQVRRTTDLTARSVDFASGSVLTEEDLDNSNIQTFHAAQEAVDKSNDGITLGADDKWDAQGNIIKNVADPVANTDAVNKQFISANLPNINTVAGISSDVTTVAGISSDVTAVAADATDIGTVATNIANVNTNATNIASINTNAANITAIQNASANALSTAADVVTTNANVVAAQAAQAAAETAADDFTDRYYGAHADDSAAQTYITGQGLTVDTGDVYFNTTSNIIRVYNGSSWDDAFVSTAGILTSANNLSDVADATTSRSNLGLGTAATTASTDYATAAQGTLASSALQPADIGSTVQAYDADTAKLDVSQTFTASQSGATQTASVSGSTTLDFASYQNFVLTLTGNTTLANPTTETVGQSGYIVFSQTAGYTVSLGTEYETAGGAGITLSASGDDVVPYIVIASGRILLGAPQLAFA